ncbi:hypothetical protein H8Z59_20285 [Mycolicibacterium fortuitum]|uniref:hypothetical protein n=1 Tax=Mycolicibacterium fortuitum TaxID=1766 RepID=UPI0007FDB3E1|nr:hypothetical protein [Mycolicibacterium fortuitum]OBG87853.1 hypothetical protein A5699_18450 [Mycobacterium sp. E802]UBV19658.1 hypothetical protein H8Z59_20285 [Mycolicibacterium fortuitum]
MPFSEDERRLRAELAAELGFYPATLDPADIDRHRRLNAALDAAPTIERIARKYAHLREERRRAEIEQRGRRQIADLYEDGLPRG